MSFLPEGYKPQTGSGAGNFFKIQEGKQKIRIVTDATVGFQYWTQENKPVSTKEYPINPPDIRVEDGKKDKIKEFWAVGIWDYDAKQLKVWQFTQASLKESILAYFQDEDWGNPRGYDLSITKSGKGLDTKYTVIAGNKGPVSAEIKAALAETDINLKALFDGGDPFASVDEFAEVAF